MTTFKFDMRKYASNCIMSLESCNYDNTRLWTIIAPSTLTFGDVTVRKCYTCKMYIHPNRIYKYMTSECQFYSSKDQFKGQIACDCGVVLRQNKYSKHLFIKTHINYWDNYYIYIINCN